MPASPKADSTIELATSRPATRRPLTVRIGPSALRKHVAADDRAACEPAAGRDLDVLAAELVDHRRPRHLADEHDEDDRERDRRAAPGGRRVSRNPSPEPNDGNQPSCTAKTAMSTIDADERRDRGEHGEPDEHDPVEHAARG